MAAPSAALDLRRSDPAWGRALANRRFRSLLLLIAAVPITIAYVWYGLVVPLVSGRPNDFVLVYLAGARSLAQGVSPYLCSPGGCTAYGHYWARPYPPVVFWLIQPLAGLDQRTVVAIALVAANLLVLLFVWLVLRALEIRDWQLRLLALLATVSFAPTMTELQNRNLQIVLLALSGAVLLAWIRHRDTWGGAALGMGLAVKLMQAPLLLLAAWRRRVVFTAAAAGGWAVLWVAGAPQYLPDYFLHVGPYAQGSGDEMNVAPLGALARILHPESLYQQGRGVDFPVIALTVAAAIAAVVLTAWRLRAPFTDRDGRALEIAATVAVSPLLITVVSAGQLVLLLLPMIVLVDYGLRVRSQATVGAVAASWFLIGPSYLAFTNAFAAGSGVPGLFELWSQTALAGAVVLWLASLHALKVHRLQVSAAAAVGSRDR